MVEYKERESKNGWRLGAKLVVTAGVAMTLQGASCLPKPPPPPVAMKLSVPAVKVHDSPEQSHDGVSITVTPIDQQNFRDFPQVSKRVKWDEMVGTGEATQTVTRAADVNLVPLPAFQVRITNDTGHVIRLTRTVFRLQDNLGRKYQTFTGTQEVLAWIMSDLSRGSLADNQGFQNSAAQQIQVAVSGLPLLNRNIELLKGDEWTGYLVFNLGNSDYTELMNSVERFTVRLAEIPIETDEAGNTTRTTEFSFVVDKTAKEIDVMCPASTQVPSWEAGCKVPR